MRRRLMLGGAMALIFAAVAGILVNVMPGPLKNSDYFLIGSVATLATLGVMFLIIVTTSQKGGVSETFFKRRKKRM